MRLQWTLGIGFHTLFLLEEVRHHAYSLDLISTYLFIFMHKGPALHPSCTCTDCLQCFGLTLTDFWAWLIFWNFQINGFVIYSFIIQLQIKKKCFKTMHFGSDTAASLLLSSPPWSCATSTALRDVNERWGDKYGYEKQLFTSLLLQHRLYLLA